MNEKCSTLDSQCKEATQKTIKRKMVDEIKHFSGITWMRTTAERDMREKENTFIQWVIQNV